MVSGHPWEMENLASLPKLADVESKLEFQLQSFMEKTDDPILCGPIARPPEEAEILNRIWNSIKKRAGKCTP